MPSALTATSLGYQPVRDQTDDAAAPGLARLLAVIAPQGGRGRRRCPRLPDDIRAELDDSDIVHAAIADEQRPLIRRQRQIVRIGPPDSAQVLSVR